jgi:hypothetical protein
MGEKDFFICHLLDASDWFWPSAGLPLDAHKEKKALALAYRLPSESAHRLYDRLDARAVSAHVRQLFMLGPGHCDFRGGVRLQCSKPMHEILREFKDPSLLRVRKEVLLTLKIRLGSPAESGPKSG